VGAGDADLLAEGGFVRSFKVDSLFDRRFEGLAAKAVRPRTRGDGHDHHHDDTRGADTRRASPHRYLASGAAPSRPARDCPASRLIGPGLVLALWGCRVRRRSAGPRCDRGALDGSAHGPVTLWSDGTLSTDVLTSLERAGYGFALGLTAGVVLALAAGLSRVGEALIDGTVQLNRAIPTLGLIPLFILWLGIGETFKIAIIAIVVYIPIYLNLHAALSGIDHRFVELAEVQGLSRVRFIRQIVHPRRAAGFFVGLRLGVTGSWPPWSSWNRSHATSGLGYLMFQAQNYGPHGHHPRRPADLRRLRPHPPTARSASSNGGCCHGDAR